MSTDHWIHAAMVYRGPGAGIRAYINGTQVEGNRSRSQSNSATSGHVIIGRRFGKQDYGYCTCMVDELMLWNSMLTDEGVQALYELY